MIPGSRCPRMVAWPGSSSCDGSRRRACVAHRQALEIIGIVRMPVVEIELHEAVASCDRGNRFVVLEIAASEVELRLSCSARRDSAAHASDSRMDWQPRQDSASTAQ